MELGSYHAIVACVAAGAGVAIVPESVLGTVQSALVAVHSLPKVLSDVATPLIWRTGEAAAPVVALRELVRQAPRSSTLGPLSCADMTAAWWMRGSISR